jgi:hypothetical protein
MRYCVLFGVIALAVAFELVVLVGASDESLASFDPHHPATLLPIVASGLRNIQSCVREWIDVATAGFRDRIRHEGPTQAPAP